MAEKVCNSCGNHDKEESSFAKELLQGYKKQFKAVFIALIVVLCMWFATIAGFLYFINQYDYVSYDLTTDNGGDAMYQEGNYSTFNNN